MIVVFDNKNNAEDSLKAVNAVYGCPIVVGSYRMDSWSEISENASGTQWAFAKPEERFGVSQDVLLDCIVGQFSILADYPEGWLNEE